MIHRTCYQIKACVVTKYYPGGAMRVGATLYYTLSDHLGSTSITVDPTGNKTEIRYKAWGEVRYQSGGLLSDRTYTGQRTYTSDFGLMYYNARWYDNQIGHFAQADNIPLKVGDTQPLDRFAYVSNNPIMRNDPTGHTEQKCTDRWDPQQSKTIHECHDVASSGGGIASVASIISKYCNAVVHYDCVNPWEEQMHRMQMQDLAGARAFQHWIASFFGSAGKPMINYSISTGQYRNLSTGRFFSPRDPDFPWPPFPGLDTQTRTTLPEDLTLSRLGSLGGRFASIPGTSASARGMAPGTEGMPETLLRVVKPLDVTSGPISEVPEFGAIGGGEGIVFDNPIASYIPEFLEIIP